MKRLLSYIGCMLVAVAMLSSCNKAERHVVILFTNDTHSQIEPLDANAKKNADMGGVVRRKVLIDSLRNIYPDALLVDAGDAVQGTPYFNFYAGEVETLVLNKLGYDVRTLGNHEFDNGGEALTAMLSAFNGTTVSTNYTYNNPALGNEVVPSCILSAGNVKVGFVGLNVNPKGLLFPAHAKDVVYHDPIVAADSMAFLLRKEGADIVIALSHLGYTADSEDDTDVIDSVLVQNTRNIDLVIGGHSHTTLFEPAIHANLDGRNIVVGQTGKSGAYLGFVDITIPVEQDGNLSVEYKLLPVDARYDNRLDKDFTSLLAPYKAQVDSVMSVALGTTDDTLYVARPESPLTNWACDAFADIARKRSGKRIDFSIINTGGVRMDIMPGTVTRGNVWKSFPFTNYMTIVQLKGSDVKQLFEQIANNGGEGVSSEVRLTIDDGKVAQLTIGGNPIDNNRIYNIATLNFVAEGGDGMVAFNNALSRKDYPGFVYELFEAYITEQTQQGKTLHATNDHRITIK
ncbi:MAG: bifunctional metallophosphatase/5'-nucleotidase [Bacteroidaceae bacterium]|nr:bifunctional metallophosphatase/5'-nucleotidase [Bacteroidaceae bacterium]